MLAFHDRQRRLVSGPARARGRIDGRVRPGPPRGEALGRRPALSVGLYALPAGGVDGQSPHTEDEIYVVLSGRATIRVGSEERSVMAGSVVFVGAGVDHRFHDIEEDLAIIVVFAPPEGARG